MAKAKQLPSGNWRVQASVSVNGEVYKRSFTEPTAKKAEQAAEQWQEHIKMIGQDTSRMTVKEAILDYIQLNQHNLSPSTIREYNRIANKDFPEFIHKPLYALSCPMIKRSMNAALETLSPKTVKNRYALLQRILSIYHPEFIWAIEYPRQRKAKKAMYSDTYIKQIFQALKGTDFEIEAYLGMLSMRASEVAGAKWEDVNYEEKTLQICRTKLINQDNTFIVVDQTKTAGSERTIYLPDYVCQILRLRQQNTKSEYISSVNPNQYWQHLNRILRKNNVQPIGFHKLRHIYSTVSSRLGIDAQIRMENGGWSSEKIMDGNYRHPMTEAQIDANAKMNTYIGNLTEPSAIPSAPKRLRLKRNI